MNWYFPLSFYIVISTKRNTKGDVAERQINFNLPAAPDDDFKVLRSRVDDAYVDTSLFIEEFCETDETRLIISRPPKYGKTVNMNMLLRFLKIPYDEHEARLNRNLFLGGDVEVNGRNKTLTKLKIADRPNIIAEHFAKYPVIWLNLKDCRFTNLFHWMNCVNKKILHFYSECKCLQEYAKREQKKLNLDGFQCLPVRDLFKTNLRTLAEFMSECYKKKVIVLIDNLDYAINEAYLSRDTNSTMFKCMRDLLNEFLTYNIFDNGSIMRAVITTLMPIPPPLGYPGRTNSIMDEDLPTFYGYIGKAHSSGQTKSVHEKILTKQMYWDRDKPSTILHRIPANSTTVGEIDDFLRNQTREPVEIKKDFFYDGVTISDVFTYFFYSGYFDIVPPQNTTLERPHQMDPKKYKFFETTLNPAFRPILQRAIMRWIGAIFQLRQTDQLFLYLTQLRLPNFNQLVEQILHKATLIRLYSGTQRFYIDMFEGLICGDVEYYRYRHATPSDCDERLDVTFVHTTETGCVVRFVIIVMLAKANDTETLKKTANRVLHTPELAMEGDANTIQYILKMGIAFRDGSVGVESHFCKTMITGPPTCKTAPEDFSHLVAPYGNPNTIVSDANKTREQFRSFITSELPAVSDVPLRILEECLRTSKQNRLILKQFLKSKDTTDNFNQTIYKIIASVINPDTYFVECSSDTNAVNTITDQATNFVKKYRHIIETVIETVYELHNDTGVMSLLNEVQRILDTIRTVPVTEKTTISGVVRSPKIHTRLLNGASKWINKIKSTLGNGTGYFYRKLAKLLRIGVGECTADKPAWHYSSD